MFLSQLKFICGSIKNIRVKLDFLVVAKNYLDLSGASYSAPNQGYDLEFVTSNDCGSYPYIPLVFAADPNMPIHGRAGLVIPFQGSDFQALLCSASTIPAFGAYPHRRIRRNSCNHVLFVALNERGPLVA